EASEVSFNAAMCFSPWAQALQLLRNLEGLKPTDAIGSNAAASCMEHWVWALQLLKRLGLRQLEATTISFNSTISAGARTTSWHQTLQLWNSMGAQEDIISRNGLITAVASTARMGATSRWPEALHLCSASSAKRLQPSLITYNATINVCEKAEVWPWVLELLRMLGPSLDLFSNNGALKACAWDLSLVLLHHMGHLSLEPDQVSLSASMGFRWRHSVALLRAECLPVPNEVSMGAALNACEKSTQWLKAIVLLGLMPTSQLKANSTIYNTTISACEKGFTWAQAFATLQQMMRSRVQRTETTINALVSACEKCSTWLWALHLLAPSTVRGPPRAGSPMGLNAAMAAGHKGHCSWRRILRLLADTGELRTAVSFDSALAALSWEWTQGLHLLRQMQCEVGCTGFSYELLMNALDSAPRHVLLAHELLTEDEGVRKGVRMGQTRTVLVGAKEFSPWAMRVECHFVLNLGLRCRSPLV
ncbi:unnamed protein product, partial [Durusdinium trenchii]